MGLLSVALRSVVFVAFSVCAQAQEGRQVVDPASNPIAKTVVQVAQLNGIAAGEGNGFVIGTEGCHVLTNFHVAFGKGIAADGSIILVDEKEQEVGHVVSVGVDLDSNTGTFKRNIKARVIEFGNFESGTTQGMRGDIALLRLADCLGESYGVLKIELSKPGQVAPEGPITSFSFSRTSKSTWALLMESGCAASPVTPIAGVFIATCAGIGGMSGSPMLRQETNGMFTVLGMTSGQLTLNSGKRVTYALHSSLILKFIENAPGGKSVQIGEFATHPMGQLKK